MLFHIVERKWWYFLFSALRRRWLYGVEERAAEPSPDRHAPRPAPAL